MVFRSLSSTIYRVHYTRLRCHILLFLATGWLFARKKKYFGISFFVSFEHMNILCMCSECTVKVLSFPLSHQQHEKSPNPTKCSRLPFSRFITCLEYKWIETRRQFTTADVERRKFQIHKRVIKIENTNSNLSVKTRKDWLWIGKRNYSLFILESYCLLFMKLE